MPATLKDGIDNVVVTLDSPDATYHTGTQMTGTIRVMALSPRSGDAP